MTTTNDIKDKVIQVLKEVYDPELDVNIYDLGLIDNIEWCPKEKKVRIVMILTTPSCPAAGSMRHDIEINVLRIPEVAHVDVTIDRTIQYSMDRLSEEGKLILTGMGLLPPS